MDDAFEGLPARYGGRFFTEQDRRRVKRNVGGY